RDALLQLRVGQPLLIVLVTGGILLDVGNPPYFFLGLALAVSNNRVGSHTKLHGRQPPALATRREIPYLFPDFFRRIAVHHVGVTLLRDQVLGYLGLAPGIDHWSRERDRLWLKNQVFDLVILACIIYVVVFPGLIYHIKPL